MATGYIIKMPDGSTQQVPFADASKYVDPNQLSQWNQKIGIPTQALQSGQLDIQNKQIQQPGLQANTNVDVQTALPKIQILNSDAVVAQNKQDQIDEISKVQKLFDQLKGKDNKVSPDTYNAEKDLASKSGIDGNTFDSKFEQSYTNPNNMFYNTPTDLATQKEYSQTKRLIQAQLDQFNNIPGSEKAAAQAGQDTVLNNPYLSKIFAPNASSYEKARLGLASQLSQLAGGGQGSGLRVTQAELDRWASLLPSTKNNNPQNDKNLETLNGEIKAKFNVNNGLDSNYLPKSSGNKLGGWQ